MKKQNNIYRTVKIDERYCGIGLFNIRKIVEKYNGEFSVSHSDNVFSVSVMLSLLWGKIRTAVLTAVLIFYKDAGF